MTQIPPSAGKGDDLIDSQSSTRHDVSIDPAAVRVRLLLVHMPHLLKFLFLFTDRDAADA